MCSYITDNPRCIVIGVYPSPPCSTMSPSKKERKSGKKTKDTGGHGIYYSSLFSSLRSQESTRERLNVLQLPSMPRTKIANLEPVNSGNSG
jgi:hypothetical protein